MSLQSKTLDRVEFISTYRTVSEKEYLRAIKKALSEVQRKLNSIEGDTYTRRRAEEVYRALKKEVDDSTQGFLTGFFQDMFRVIMGDARKMERDASGYIDGFFRLDDEFVKNVLGFKEIFFMRERKDGTKVPSYISIDSFLKSVDKDTKKRVKSILVSGAVQGQHPLKIARQIAKIKGVEQRHLRTVVNTILMDAQQRVNIASLKKNQKLYDHFIYDATIDGRTTDYCKNHNDKIYKTFEDIPKSEYPPNHPNCRSIIRGVVYPNKPLT